MRDLHAEQICFASDEIEEKDTVQGRPSPGAIGADLNKSSGLQVLVVDDDTSLSSFLSMELEADSFVVDQIHDGAEALGVLQTNPRYDLLVLDLNLPNLDGFNLLKKLRPTQPRLPVLVLTACARVEDRVRALRAGADDCLTKPFSLLEFKARVQALLRRNAGAVPKCSTIGDLSIYRDEHRVERNGRRIELTTREYAILDIMMRNAGHPVSRASLLEEVWNMSPESSTNIVDVYMKYVRDKIDLPGEPRLTHTVRGFGYELRVS
jgi:two-component system copper resistance phosphate regulon response regulator CusR